MKYYMKTYNSGEALAMLEKDPSLEFKNIGEGKLYTLYCDENKIKIISDEGIDSGFKIGDRWILIQKSVDFMKAIKEYSNGKTIYCEIDNNKYTYIPKLKKESYLSGYGLIPEETNTPITAYEIINGKWYIE